MSAADRGSAIVGADTPASGASIRRASAPACADEAPWPIPPSDARNRRAAQRRPSARPCGGIAVSFPVPPSPALLETGPFQSTTFHREASRGRGAFQALLFHWSRADFRLEGCVAEARGTFKFHLVTIPRGPTEGRQVLAPSERPQAARAGFPSLQTRSEGPPGPGRGGRD
jgi:hypothetical protein